LTACAKENSTNAKHKEAVLASAAMTTLDKTMVQMDI
jgi:hypothetical protein